MLAVAARSSAPISGGRVWLTVRHTHSAWWQEPAQESPQETWQQGLALLLTNCVHVPTHHVVKSAAVVLAWVLQQQGSAGTPHPPH